jgi:hypothetical protein
LLYGEPTLALNDHTGDIRIKDIDAKALDEDDIFSLKLDLSSFEDLFDEWQVDMQSEFEEERREAENRGNDPNAVELRQWKCPKVKPISIGDSGQI